MFTLKGNLNAAIQLLDMQSGIYDRTAYLNMDKMYGQDDIWIDTTSLPA